MAVRKRAFVPHFFERDASYLHLVKAGLIECGATALFLFFTIGTVTSGCRASSNASVSGNSAGLAGVAPGACALQVSNITNIALAFGISIFVLVYATAAYTGGHLNPAVSLGLVVAGRISFVRGLVYTVCQVLGATVGAALIRAVDPLAFAAIGGGANKLATGVTYGQAWGMEAILTFSLVMMVFAATDNFHAAKVSHLPVLAPLAIGMTVFVCHLVAVPIDGCSINPARSFGPALAANRWHHQWVFWVGPYAGAIVAALVYELAFREHPAVPEKKAMDIEEGDEKVPSVPTAASGKFPHITSGPEAGKAMPAQA